MLTIRKTLNMKKILLFISLITSGLGFSQTGIYWGASGDVAPGNFGNNFPRVVMDGNGNPVVSWTENGLMLFARWTGSSFGTPDTISDLGVSIAGANWMGPEIASHGDTIYGVYKQTPETANTSPVWLVRSLDGGQSFSAPVQVNVNTADSLTRFPCVTADDNGNPLVAFMEFNPDFSDARWVVAKSTDAGSSFGNDVKASGWSDPTSEVCDCCPGKITASGNTVVMLYRDNNSNIRDTWAGVSTDGGQSFTAGMDVDQQGWFITSCPSSGPDGFILGDSLYTSFMSGQTGEFVANYSNSHLPSLTGSSASDLLPASAGVVQNYPRTNNSGNKAGYVWKQNSNGSNMILFRYSSDISNGFPSAIDTIASDNAVSGDVALSGTQVCVVWQDFISGTVKYRMGTYDPVGLTENELEVKVYPNPTSDFWYVTTINGKGKTYNLVDVSGKQIYSGKLSKNSLEIEARDLPDGIYFLELDHERIKLIKF